jgi:hypothetical protein
MEETNKEHFANGFERRDKDHDKDPFVPDEKPNIPVCPLHDKRDILFSGITTSVDGILNLVKDIRKSQLEEITFRAEINKRISSVEKHIGITAKIIIGLCALQLIEVVFIVVALML